MTYQKGDTSNLIDYERKRGNEICFNITLII